MTVTECEIVVRAEEVYLAAIDSRVQIHPGYKSTTHLEFWRTGSKRRSGASVAIEVRPNSVWRRGRLFLVCPCCQRRATRLYAPVVGSDLGCRRCWKLTYESQRWSYHGAAREVCHWTTIGRWEDRRLEAYERRQRRLERLARLRGDSPRIP